MVSKNLYYLKAWVIVNEETGEMDCISLPCKQAYSKTQAAKLYCKDYPELLFNEVMNSLIEKKPLFRFHLWAMVKCSGRVEYFDIVAHSQKQAWFYYCYPKDSMGNELGKFHFFDKNLFSDSMTKDEVLASEGLQIPFNSDMKEGCVYWIRD